MYLLTVAPITRGVPKDALTYFSKESIAIGMMVMVPVRNREVPAIIIESRKASDAKEAIKSSTYVMRKIARSKPYRVWSPAFLKAAEETARFSAQKFGETLFALTPSTILDAHSDGRLAEPNSATQGNSFEIQAIQNDIETRRESYRRLVRESFVRHESVFVCLPTEEDVERVARGLGHGIENYTFAFHGSTGKKRILDRWQKVATENHAVLVIGTAQYLGIPRHFKTIILDEESSHAWKTPARPFIDLRTFVEQYACATKSTLIIGSAILRAETQERIARGAIGEFDRIAGHTLGSAKAILIDPRIEERMMREKTGKRGVVVISKELHTLLTETRAAQERVFLLAARKGLAPVTSCDDCGTLIRCPECDTPLVIHRRESPDEAKNLFICHGCGFTRAPEEHENETCPQCGSWRLQGVGIGIDLIKEKILELFPNAPLFTLDGDRAKTRAQAKKIVAEFERSPGAILVATPMAVPLLGAIAHTAIVSIDSLFAVLDIRISERIFALVLALREKTAGTLLIQTRADDTTIFTQALGGNLAEFAKNELSIRKNFSYPPYGTIIKITIRGARAELPSTMEKLRTFLTEYDPIAPQTINRDSKNTFRTHLILRIPESAWPEKRLLAKLRALPPQFTVEVNPDHLL